MIIAGVVLTGVVLVGGWFFVNKDSKSMKAKPVAMEEKTDTAATMEKKDAPTEPMKKVEESTADEWSTADMKKDKAMTKNEVAGAMEKKEAMKMTIGST